MWSAANCEAHWILARRVHRRHELLFPASASFSLSSCTLGALMNYELDDVQGALLIGMTIETWYVIITNITTDVRAYCEHRHCGNLELQPIRCHMLSDIGILEELETWRRPHASDSEFEHPRLSFHIYKSDRSAGYRDMVGVLNAGIFKVFPCIHLCAFARVLESAHTALVAHSVYYYAIIKRGNLSSQLKPVWCVIVTEISILVHANKNPGAYLCVNSLTLVLNHIDPQHRFRWFLRYVLVTSHYILPLTPYPGDGHRPHAIVRISLEKWYCTCWCWHPRQRVDNANMELSAEPYWRLWIYIDAIGIVNLSRRRTQIRYFMASDNIFMILRLTYAG